MAEASAPPTRYAPALDLPRYAYIPGHGLPHPVNSPGGHLYDARDSTHEPPISSSALAALPTESNDRRRALAAAISVHSRWLHALDLFNGGWYWEAHEAWEGFWNALGRSTPEAKFVQGLIHLAAACVKIRDGKPAGVRTHTRRARELMGEARAAQDDDDEEAGSSGTLGLLSESIAAAFVELEKYEPKCWHTSKCPVVKVLAAGLQKAG